MVVGRYEMFKDTLGSDWKKNKIIGGAASELSKAAIPPTEVAPNIYGSGQPAGQVLSRNPAPSLSSPPPMLAQQPTPIARMQNNAGATGLGQTARQMLASNVPGQPPTQTGRVNEHIPGNLDPSKPMSYVKNTDGSVSTVRSMSIGTDNGETLIPTVSPEGNILSNDQAVDRYRKTGDNFGSWKSVSDANKYAATLHENQANLLNDPIVKRLSPGMSLSADKSTYTMGTPGQDGYGRMTVSPGAGQRSAAANQLAAGVQRPNNGYEVSGDPNAVARFNRPVANPGNPAPDALNGGSRAAMLEQQTAQQRLAATSQAPKYMTKEEGISAGVGWKGRGQIYAQQMDAYNKATGNQNALDVEQMREGGAGARAMLAAQGINDRNAIEREGQQSANEIARKRLTSDLALNDTRIGTEQLGQQKGQMEIDAAKRTDALHQQYLGEKDPLKQKELGNQILTIQGKNPKEWQITTREEAIDPNNPMSGTTKVPYAVNLNDPTQTIELGGKSGGAGGSAMTEAPPSAVAYLKKNPDQAEFFKQKYGYLPGGI